MFNLARWAALFALVFLRAVVADPEFSVPFAFAPPAAPAGGITELGAVELAARAPDGLSLHGLSALGWDQDEGKLVAVSDFGYLVWLIPRFAGGRLVAVEFAGRYPLRNRAGEPLRRPDHDAEGLTLRGADNARPGDTELVISFEQRPRLHRFSNTGRYRGAIALPAPFASTANFTNPNHGLEAVTWHPHFGYLLGAESALAGLPSGLLTLASTAGRVWRFPAIHNGGALVDVELADDGVVVLERRFISPLQPLIISLRVLALAADPPQIVELGSFSSAAGWGVDNFEGIARHRARHYFIISDDNANPLQKTLLVYLAIRTGAKL